jgi:hypothetical protein
MELYEYNKLNLTDRANILCNDGIFIVHAQNCALYVLFQFLCEVLLHNYEIVEIRTFKKGIMFDKLL